MTCSRRRQISSADLVGANDDLTVEILLRLPAKYAVRLKLVSKRWLSLISDRYFILRHSLLNSDAISPPVGLILLEINRSNPIFTFVSLDENKNETTTEEKPTRYIQCFDPHAPAPIKISDSSNGLLLCYSRTPSNATQCKLYIVNPTTHQFTTLPEPPVDASNWKKFNLAYDPCKSPVYRVYGVELSNSDSISNIHEYSSDSGVWQLFSAHHLRLEPIIRNFNGVFCNGANHWVCIGGCCYRFDVDQNSIKRVPKPPLPEYWNGGTDLKYFGECHGNLNFIAFDKGLSIFFVYELHKDCSGWFVKYSLEEKGISAAFPEISDHQRPLPVGILQHSQYKFCSVLSYVGVKNEEPKLVISIPGKIISYSFKDNTFDKIHDFHDKFAKFKAFNFNGTWSCI